RRDDDYYDDDHEDYDDKDCYDDDDDDEDDDEDEPRSLFVPVMTAVTIAFIVVAVFFVLWLVKGVLQDGNRNTTKYAMPDLVGMDYYEAKDTYTYLDIQIGETEYSTYEKDLIFFQDVAVDTPVVSGQTITVNVSLGRNMATVPDVKGYNYEYAKKMLEQEGFIVDLKYELSSDGTEASDVIRTEPAAGEEAESGSPIIVYVSKGPNVDSIEIMNLVGMTIQDATNLCEYYGLVVDAQAEASLEEENIVFAQSIEAGEFVDAGTTIILTYSNGEDPSGIIPFTLPIPQGAQGRFALDFIDEKGVTKTTTNINAGYSSSAVVDVQGTGTERIAVVLTNLNSGLQAEIGVYNFDFANATFSAVREGVTAAFESVGAFPTEPVTEAPTEAPTEPPIVTDPPHTDPPATQAPPEPPATQEPEPVIPDPPMPPLDE
ncbi:MAG: PASTA domain-containing protein, partial [Oscillospiraceae bacterium]|nr:PASTA domain-containing protein [Oscillospiraceae bacterium]